MIYDIFGGTTVEVFEVFNFVRSVINFQKGAQNINQLKFIQKVHRFPLKVNLLLSIRQIYQSNLVFSKGYDSDKLDRFLGL